MTTIGGFYVISNPGDLHRPLGGAPSQQPARLHAPPAPRRRARPCRGQCQEAVSWRTHPRSCLDGRNSGAALVGLLHYCAAPRYAGADMGTLYLGQPRSASTLFDGIRRRRRLHKPASEISQWERLPFGGSPSGDPNVNGSAFRAAKNNRRTRTTGRVPCPPSSPGLRGA